MVFEGYLKVGSTEIVNSERIRGLAASADCYLPWLQGPECETLQDALGDEPYTMSNMPLAPWFDQSLPDLSGRFLGVYGLSISGLNSSTRSVESTEGIGDGGTLGRTRKGMMSARVRATLLAKGRDALDYGVSWLNSALDPDVCGQHGSGCGTADMEFLTDCPPERREIEDGVDENDEITYRLQSDEEYAADVDELRRFLHDVAITSGPLVMEEHVFRRPKGYYGVTVEWTITSERAWIYSKTRPVELPVTPTVVMQDTPYNLVPYPSAELADGTVVASKNYSTNPSVETNATGWSFGSSGGITTGMLAAGRVTGELSAVGSAAYRVVFTATGAGAGGTFYAGQQVSIAGRPAGARVSINYWAAELLMSGTPVRGDIELVAIWSATAPGGALRTDVLGTVPVDGGALSVKSIEPPDGANFVSVRAVAHLESWSADTVVRLYVDALAVTVP